MPDEDKLEVAGNVWDSLSTGKKLGLAGMGFAVVAATFWGGYTFSDMRAANEIAELRAKHERELTDLKNKESNPTKFRLSVVPPDAGLPKYSEAETNDISMTDMRDRYAEFQSQTRTKTSIQKPSFFEEYKGQRFKWSGYVADVYDGMYDRVPYYSVSFRPDLDEPFDFRKTAYFVGDQNEEMVKGLTPDQHIVVSGVMNSEGALTQCKFVTIGDAIKASSE